MNDFGSTVCYVVGVPVRHCWWFCSTAEGSDCVVSVRGICSLMLNLFTRRVDSYIVTINTQSCHVGSCTVTIP